MSEMICKCGNEAREGQRYCHACHAEYMRAWRKQHPLSGEQRKKDNARSYAGVYKRRGKLIPEPCQDCHTYEVKMLHEDYDNPLDVIWLCRECHLERHRELTTVAC